MKTSRLASRRKPATVTPMFGTKSLSTCRRSWNEKASVPIGSASTAFSIRSRYQRRMYLAENVPVAIWTTRTVTVTTNPIRAAVEPTIADSTVLAVDGE